MGHPLSIELNDSIAIPAGWYTLGVSADVAPGGLLAATLAGIELVLYRSESGDLHCVEDRCPHMGGRFTAGGEVKGERLICPIHRFEFLPDGQCHSSGYGTPAPRACTRVWHCLDRNGLLLVFYHPNGEAPTWEPESLDAAGWLPMRMFRTELVAHPHLITEGIADKGHLTTVHGYEEISLDLPFQTDTPCLRTAYSFVNTGSLPGQNRVVEWLGRFFQTRTKVRFTYQSWGLGYSVTDVILDDLGLVTRHFVNPTPTRDGKVLLFHSLALRRIDTPARIHPAMRFLPRRWVESLMQRVLLKGFLRDLEDDISIWSNMRSVAKPALAVGDGPIAQHRRWAAQFYS
jgi:nitrite reductase/ring-hydroxylating ferredoxin subunit